MNQIPDWETTRKTEDPESYFLRRVLSKEVLNDLSWGLLRASGVPSGATGSLRCPVTLVPLDVVLRHLEASHATGELSIETGEETVMAWLEQGQVVLLASNHPRNYCAGSAYDFQTVPNAFIVEAVRAQEEQGLPFFISLKSNGHLAEGASLESLLGTQGERCLIRAFQAPGAITSFLPLTKLPTIVRASRLNTPLNQLLLACYRTVNDWFTLEKLFPEMDAILAPSPDSEASLADLDLEAEEAKILDAVRSGRSVLELAETTGAKPFEVCRVLYRFVKLGLVGPGSRRELSAPSEEPFATPANSLPMGFGVDQSSLDEESVHAPENEVCAGSVVLDSNQPLTPEQRDTQSVPAAEDLASAAACGGNGTPTASSTPEQSSAPEGPDEVEPPSLDTAHETALTCLEEECADPDSPVPACASAEQASQLV